MPVEAVKLMDTVLERHSTSAHVDSTGITGGSTVASSHAADISM